MLLAAAMLRRGDDIDQVEAISDVPYALLDLMSAELSGTGSSRRHATGEVRPGGIPGALPGGSSPWWSSRSPQR
jgi:hypothetical protein